MSQPKVRRSHQGCDRCKRRRQRCDERKPNCGRCTAADEPCSYTVKLKWGGRIPRRSPSQKLSNPVFEASPETNCLEFAPETCPNQSLLSNLPSPSVPSFSAPNIQREYLPPAIGPLSHLPRTYRFLLMHYLLHASRVTSTHLQIQQRITRVILPLALQTPSLLHATLALSALHLSALTDGTDTDTSLSFISSLCPKQIYGFGLRPSKLSRAKSYPLPPLITTLLATSLHNLRHELAIHHTQPSHHLSPSKYALLATIRTLCVAEIHCGNSILGDWRKHVEGARALLLTGKGMAGGGFEKVERGSLERSDAPARSRCSNGEAEPQWLAESWYSCIESLTAMTTGRGLVREYENINDVYEGSETKLRDPQALAGFKNWTVCDEQVAESYLDIYTGCMPGMNLLFRRIGAAAKVRRQLEHNRTFEEGDLFPSEEVANTASLLEAALSHEAAYLSASIYSLMTDPRFHPSLIPLLSSSEKAEFISCNRNYGLSAQIHILRRIRGLPREDEEVQDCVKGIIECALGMRIGGLGPWVVMTTPLFTAGTEALMEEREVVRRLLGEMWRSLGIRNCKRSLEVLEKKWADEEDWEEGDGELDFIPY